jgi:XTP/dITP diphosphohydrolase
MELVVATTNKGKLKEISRLLADTGILVKGLEEIAGLPEIVEDGDTFEANARKKALTVARHCGCLTLADDSGLVVKALQGQPGVYSARYAGPEASDTDNNRKLLTAMSGFPREQREAAFHCAMALCDPSGDCRVFHGRLDGLILESPQGSGGFGYDPLFMVPEYGKALAELPLEIKNRISHRGEALRKTLEYLQQM